MAIKKLQNNFTTPEQSKRLLELGVPADSADCYHNQIAEKPYFLTMPYSYTDWSDKRNPPLPCWSVGRLIEIIDICALGEISSDDNEEYPATTRVKKKLGLEYVEYLVKSIERAVQLGTIDFLKLED